MPKINKITPIILLISVLFGLSAHCQNSTAAIKPTQGALFNNSTLTDSDYLRAIERAADILETAQSDAEFGTAAIGLMKSIEENKKSIDLILKSLKQSSSNVRNQQMYQTMLSELQLNVEQQNKMVDADSERLAKIKKKISSIARDTVFMALVKDTLRIKQFNLELHNLKNRYIHADSIISSNINTMTAQKRLVVNANLSVANAVITVQKKLEKSGINLFGNEYLNLWDLGTKPGNTKISSNIDGKWQAEKNVVAYYFNYNFSRLLVLVLLMAAMGWYIKRNINTIKSLDKFHNLGQLNFKYLTSSVWLPAAVLGLNIAIVTNLHAPALYVELLQFFLLGILSLLFQKNWLKKSLANWYFLVIIYVVLCFFDLFVDVSFLERCIFIAVNILGIRYGIIQLKSIREQLYIKGFFKWASVIFISLNAISIIANIFGRVTISHMLSLAAIIALTQIIALSVLLKIVLEIILLQIYTTRLKRGIDKLFNQEALSQTLRKPFVLLISYMWFIVIASNLNIWESLATAAGTLLHKPIVLGSVSFTLAGVLLFFIIVWIAHLLQQYVAYFFGEVDNDEDEENINKQQHSKLLITRLIVLIVGYLLAVAASGMPMDKLSIVIGALGVGIGLGLQNIVTNFVSGIILIFDRPIQVGDIIEVSSQSGRIKSMGLRSTKINSASGAEIIIPNGNILSQNITNWTYTDNLKLVEMNCTVNGNITPENISQIILQTLEKVPLVENSRAPQIFYNALSEDNYKILIKFWCSIYRTEEVLSNARQALFYDFKDRGITFTT
ncbi:mechanosensitive ion channel family protein [Flavobacterium notoginsengisoli]|uniref:mechanosensitive ion channel family protein n=1 Tax=Flavobacterium notoginsengisoli TaxID=1478199 RepID=UPI0036331FA6